MPDGRILSITQPGAEVKVLQCQHKTAAILLGTVGLAVLRCAATRSGGSLAKPLRLRPAYHRRKRPRRQIRADRPLAKINLLSPMITEWETGGNDFAANGQIWGMNGIGEAVT